MRMFDPFGLLAPMLEASKMMAEAQVVIGLRVAGMAGLWPMAETEANRMVEEKLHAGMDAAQAMLRAGMAGQSPSAVAMAAMKPLRHKTKANARRLQRQAGGL
jgi:hypothetical protein